MKRLISTILAAVMVLMTVTFVIADEPSDWAKEEVGAAIALDLVPEELQKNYTSPVTRGQVAGMFINLIEKASGKTVGEIMESKGVEADPGAFTDTDDADVLAANALGIINGTGHNKFSPDGTLKRAQIAAIINRVAHAMGYDTSGYEHGFTDITDNYSWADGELGWPVAREIIKGVGGSRFNPGGDLTTEQAILITYRAYNVLSRKLAANTDPYEHVVIIGVDGAGYFFRDADTPNIDRIFENGAITYECVTSYPSISAECWGSMLHGVPPELHNLTNASSVPYPHSSEFPSIFKVVRDADAECELASFNNWGVINKAIIEMEIDIHKEEVEDDAAVTELILSYLDGHDPKLMFVQFDSVDGAGHATGFGKQVHLDQIHVVDEYIGRIYDKLVEKGIADETLFIVTADHGGTQNADGTGSHGGDSYEEMHIMVAAAGKTVVHGQIGEMAVRDISSIVAYAFGLDQPAGWTSRVPSGLFEGVEAVERPLYEYKANIRYENEGAATPEPGSGRYITDFFSEDDIETYLTLDSEVADALGKIRASGKGKLYFVDGYFGDAVRTEDGYILTQFKPDNNSFAVSMWVKLAAAGGNPPLLSDQNWYNAESNGFTICYEDQWLRFNLGNGETFFTEKADLPEDFRDGWVHVIFNINRDDETVGVCYDFGDFLTAALPDEMKGVSFSGDMRGMVFGMDGTGIYYLKPQAALDDIIIFNRVLTSDDVALLAEYYRAERAE